MTNSPVLQRNTASILGQWEGIQESLARVTGLSFTTLGKNGKVLAEAGDAALCELLTGTPGGDEFCRGSCLRIVAPC